MAAGKGSKVEYIDYNAIQKIVSAVLGTGGTNPTTNAADATYGYGQSISSSSVAQFAKISVSQWNTLRNDLLKARQHQSGLDESGSLALPTLDTKIAEADRAAYLSLANVIDANRLVALPSSQSNFFNPIKTATRTAGWSSTIYHTFNIAFASADQLRYFFNAGGNFKLSASLIGYSTGGSKLANEAWATLMTNMGTITFNATSTTNTGTGSPATNKGYHQLTTSDQLIFSKVVEIGNQYTPNQYDLYARKSGASLILTPTWSYLDPGAGTQFEQIDGTLTSTLAMTIASGSNVSITAPTITISGSSFY